MSNPLLLSVSNWFRRHFSDPAAVALFFTVLFVLLFLEFFGHFFLPVLISVVLAYLLASVVRVLDRWHFPHILAVSLVFVAFTGLVIFGVVWLLPIVIHQLQTVIVEFPSTFTQGHQWLNALMQQYPMLFQNTNVQDAIAFLQAEMVHIAQMLLRHLWLLIPNIITIVLYFVLVPLLLFFFLKDAGMISHWFTQFLPKDRGLITTVWHEVNQKIGCYVKGRVIEIIVVSMVTIIAFAILNMNYATLLGVLVGLSTIIPYIGAVVVTIPVILIGLMQWGTGPEFWYAMIIYTVIITLDANLLVPLLFAETMDLHPVVIILSVLVFGGLWGFWGVFFAIPLATVADTLLRAWPRVVDVVRD